MRGAKDLSCVGGAEVSSPSGPLNTSSAALPPSLSFLFLSHQFSSAPFLLSLFSFTSSSQPPSFILSSIYFLFCFLYCSLSCPSVSFSFSLSHFLFYFLFPFTVSRVLSYFLSPRSSFPSSPPFFLPCSFIPPFFVLSHHSSLLSFLSVFSFVSCSQPPHFCSSFLLTLYILFLSPPRFPSILQLLTKHSALQLLTPYCKTVLYVKVKQTECNSNE